MRYSRLGVFELTCQPAWMSRRIESVTACPGRTGRSGRVRRVVTTRCGLARPTMVPVTTRSPSAAEGPADGGSAGPASLNPAASSLEGAAGGVVRAGRAARKKGVTAEKAGGPPLAWAPGPREASVFPQFMQHEGGGALRRLPVLGPPRLREGAGVGGDHQSVPSRQDLVVT